MLNQQQENQDQFILIEKSPALNGEIKLAGAKNAVLVIMSSTILTSGKTKLYNVPISSDVRHMGKLLENLGAKVLLNEQEMSVEIDTTNLNKWEIQPEIMKKMRASILTMGPLLAKFGRADIALPGGCVIGTRPIDFHLKSFAKMGTEIDFSKEFIKGQTQKLKPATIILDYPSVGATENILMAATLTKGKTTILNAAIEPEVLDLISILNKMGAQIKLLPPATIEIDGVEELKSVEHKILNDRLEAGTFLLAAAITGGNISIPDAPAYFMEVFLEKLSQMGHLIEIGQYDKGITLHATKNPKAVSFKTMPYPGFPTDLQAPMLAAQCLADGISTIYETVYENRLIHANELKKMGAQIIVDGQKATIKGVEELYGTDIIASDIRAGAALIIAGLSAHGQTKISGIHHLKRGYHQINKKLKTLGAKIEIIEEFIPHNKTLNQQKTI